MGPSRGRLGKIGDTLASTLYFFFYCLKYVNKQVGIPSIIQGTNLFFKKSMLGTELRALCMLDRHFTIELYLRVL